MSFVSNTFRTWFQHLGLFTAVTLAVWLPANILLTSLIAVAGDDMSDSMAVRLPTIVEGILGPLVSATVLFATHRLVRGESVGFKQAINGGFSSWGRLFATRFAANFITVIGLILLIIPGLVIMVRFAFLDQSVIVDGLAHKSARERTWELVPKVIWKLLLFGFLYFVSLIALSIGLFVPLEILTENGQIPMWGYYIGDVIVSTVISCLHVPFILGLYFLYQEAKGEEVALGPVSYDTEIGETFELPPDDGNPYNAPRS